MVSQSPKCYSDDDQEQHRPVLGEVCFRTSERQNVNYAWRQLWDLLLGDILSPQAKDEPQEPPSPAGSGQP